MANDRPHISIRADTFTRFSASGRFSHGTRDIGHHSSGWWKNPDYERCRHLSLSFFDPEVGLVSGSMPRDKKLTAKIIDRVFGPDKRYLWSEPPYSPQGKAADIWHYRLFCDPAWEPILPRSEVYGRELIEEGWKSWSDVQADLAEEREHATEMLGNM